jgi:hypothetical protein
MDQEGDSTMSTRDEKLAAIIKMAKNWAGKGYQVTTVGMLDDALALLEQSPEVSSTQLENRQQLQRERIDSIEDRTQHLENKLHVLIGGLDGLQKALDQ